MQKKLFILLLITTFLSSCSWNKTETETQTKPKVKKSEFTLKSENYSYFLDLTWKLEANKETQVAAKQWWRISEMNFEEWDFVFKNTLLWKLAWDESHVNYQTASTNETNLRNLLKSQENLLNESIKNAEKALEIAKENLKAIWIQKNASSLTTEEQKKLAETKLEQAKIFLENTKKNNAQNLENLYANWVSQIRSWFRISSQTLDFLDNLLWVSEENKNKNDSFEWNLWTLKTDTKTKASDSTRIAIAKNDEFEAFYNENIKDKNPSNEKIDEWLEKILVILEDLQSTLQDSYDMLDNSTSWANFSESSLQNYKNQNLTFWQNVEWIISNPNSWVKSLITKIADLKVKSVNSLKSAQSAYESAKQGLAQISASSNQSFSNVSSQKDIVEKKVEQAEIALKTAIANKESSLKDLKSKIDLASWNKKLSQVAIWNTQIWAPFNWVITEKIWEIWQVVWAWQPIYKIADISKYKILSDISDSQLWKIKIWQETEISIDWISWKFTWKVTKIYPKVDEVSRKVKIEISLNEINNSFKIWSFARIKVKITDNNSFFIPNKFLHFDYNWAFVFDENWKKKYVSAWDEKKSENWIMEKIWFPWEMEWKKILEK